MPDLIRLPDGSVIPADLITRIDALDASDGWGKCPPLGPHVVVHYSRPDDRPGRYDVRILECATFAEAQILRVTLAAQVAAANQEADPA